MAGVTLTPEAVGRSIGETTNDGGTEMAIKPVKPGSDTAKRSAAAKSEAAREAKQLSADRKESRQTKGVQTNHNESRQTR